MMARRPLRRGFHRFGEGQNAIVSAEIGVQTDGARFAQRVNGGIVVR
jgi:hypothetical protein